MTVLQPLTGVILISLALGYICDKPQMVKNLIGTQKQLRKWFYERCYLESGLLTSEYFHIRHPGMDSSSKDTEIATSSVLMTRKLTCHFQNV